jgi:EmrB/QacA subfamily drug resistance transporter
VATTIDQAPAEGQAPNRRRYLILAICCMSILLVGLDTTIVNVALPSIHHSLHTSLRGLQWTIDAYTLVIASLLMLAGSTADRIGRRRVFQAGLLLFSLGSLACAFAPSLTLLIVFRCVQAVGGSMLNPVAMSIIRNTFTDARERAQAIGVWGGTVGVSMAAGPVLGGALIVASSWRAIFLVNVPIGLLAILLTARFVPESKAARARRVDPVGQLLVIAMLASLTYAIISGPRDSWGSATSVVLFAVAAASLVVLIRHSLRRPEPLIEVRFFRSAPFSGASAIAVCAFATLGGFLFLNTLYLQDVRHFSPLRAGLYVLPMAAMTVVFGPLSGRIVGRRGAREPLLVAGIAITASSLILASLRVDMPTAELLGAYLVFGFGFGLVNPPITNTAVSGMPAAQAGVAAAIASTSRQVGVTLGVALAGAIAGSGVAGAIGPGFAAATHPAYWLMAGLGVTIFALGLVTTTHWALDTATATAARLCEDEPPPAQIDAEQPVTARVGV